MLGVNELQEWRKLLCMYDRDDVRRHARQGEYDMAAINDAANNRITDIVNDMYQGPPGQVPLPHDRNEFEHAMAQAGNALLRSSIYAPDKEDDNHVAELKELADHLRTWVSAVRPLLLLTGYNAQAAREAFAGQRHGERNERMNSLPGWAQSLPQEVLEVSTKREHIVTLCKSCLFDYVCVLSICINFFCMFCAARNLTTDNAEQKACRAQRNECFDKFSHLWMGAEGLTFELFEDDVKRAVCTMMSRPPCKWPVAVLIYFVLRLSNVLFTSV
jgi:hypothetical protein